MMLSVVIPVYNEASSLDPLLKRLVAVLDGLDEPWEVVLVNDGSHDNTHQVLATMAASEPRLKVIEFVRNFGHQIAVAAGMDHASGDAVIVIDADLQDPPEIIPALVAQWKAGFEIVYAKRNTRRDGLFKRATAAAFYRLMRQLADVDIPLDAGDFALYDRAVVDVLRAMPERHRFLRGMRAWTGFRQIGVPFDRDERHAGSTKYSFGKMLSLALDGLTGFSTFPLRLTSYLGWSAAAVGLLAGIWVIVRQIVFGYPVPGWASLIVTVLFFSGVQLIMLGAVGEYVGRVFDQVRARPLYIVRERRNIDPSLANPPHAVICEPVAQGLRTNPGAG